MAINGKTAGSVQSSLTSQTTTEGNFRTGLTDVAQQLDTNERVLDGLNAPGGITTGNTPH